MREIQNVKYLVLNQETYRIEIYVFFDPQNNLLYTQSTKRPNQIFQYKFQVCSESSWDNMTSGRPPYENINNM